MDLYDSYPLVINKLNLIKSISSRGAALAKKEVIDDSEELMEAYMEEMPKIHQLCCEMLQELDPDGEYGEL